MKTPKEASIKKRKLMLARFNLSKQFDELQELRQKVRRLEFSPGDRKTGARRSSSAGVKSNQITNRHAYKAGASSGCHA
jgi:hypothetical protein